MSSHNYAGCPEPACALCDAWPSGWGSSAPPLCSLEA